MRLVERSSPSSSASNLDSSTTADTATPNIRITANNAPQKSPSSLAFNFVDLEAMASFLRDHLSIRLIDACFCDPLGCWHHCHYSTAAACGVDSLREGFPFDGSSIPIFATIDKADLIIKPDPSTCWLDPFSNTPVLHVTCSVFNADGSPYSNCPRGISMKCQELLKNLGIGDEIKIGPEAEFFIFNSVSFDVNDKMSHYYIDGDEAAWNNDILTPTPCGGAANAAGGKFMAFGHGHRHPLKSGYMSMGPLDSLSNTRNDILLTLDDIGVKVEKHHHEAATCQVEIGVQPRGLVAAADCVMMYKYVAKNVAHRRSQTVTFMPKPIPHDNGSGMHVNVSIWKNKKNLFHDNEGSFCKMSDMAMHFIAGILFHGAALVAFCNPSINSFRRLAKGFEAPTKLAYAAGNRSVAIRVPAQCLNREGTKRIEFRTPDGTCCPYLAFSAIILAGLDGIRNKMDPGSPADCNVYENVSADGGPKDIPQSMEASLNALALDNEFLTKDGVFDLNFIEGFISFKRAEAQSFKLLPHPREFMLYYSC